MRNDENPNEIVVITGWSDADKAHQFAASPELKEAAQKAGVVGPPEVLFMHSAN
jgi:heme-degrading monooxygenase HmoA